MICCKRNMLSLLPLALVVLMSGCRSATPVASPTLAADDPESVAAVTDMPPTSESSDASEALAPPPEGLRFQTDEGTWRVGPDGQFEQLTESGILLSPWGDAGIPVAPEATNLQLPMLDLSSGESKRIDLPGRLLVEVLAESDDERGLFLLDTRSGESTGIGEALGQATWVDNERFVVSTSTMGDPSEALIYDIGRGDLVALDLPADARLVGFDRDRLPAGEDAAEPADLEWLFESELE